MRQPRPTGLALALALCLMLASLAGSPQGAAAQQTDTPPPPSDTATPEPTRTATSLPTASVTSGPTASPTKVATTESTAPVKRPAVVITGYNANPSQPGPGNGFSLDLYLANQGRSDARDVQLSLTSETFLPAGTGSVLFVDRIKDGDDATVSTSLVVVQTATVGAHPLAIAIRYVDGDGNSYSEEATISIEVATGNIRKPQVVVSAVRMPGRVAPGIPFTLSMDLANTGGMDARNVLVSPAAGPLAFQGGGLSTPVFIPAGGVAAVSLRLVAASPSEPGAASQTLDIRYDGMDGERFTATQVVGVVITGGAATDPLPMVTSYSAGQGLSLYPGQVFELSLEVTNVGVADALRTMLVFGGGSAPSTSGGTGSGGTGGSSGTSLGVFAPLETSNVRFLDRVAAGTSTQVTQRLVVDGAAKPGSYTLDVSFNYVDANGEALSNTEVISLLVSRRVALGITAMNPVTNTLAGEPLLFPIEVLNQGGDTVNVTEVSVTGAANASVANGSRFVGQLDSGASDTVEAEITADEAGEAELLVTVRYLDDLNNEQVITKTLTLAVDEAPAMPDGAERPPSEEGNLFLRLIKGFLGLGASAGQATSDVGDAMSAPLAVPATP